MSNWEEFIDLKKSAVIVVDMQNDFCHENGATARNGGDVSGVPAIVPNLQRLIDAAHAAGRPVFFIQTTHDETTDSQVSLAMRKDRKHKTCVTGTWGAEYFGVYPQQGDIEVIKHRYSAFIGTDLELRLRTLGCETLLMTGVVTSICVESTLRDGYMLDFYPILVTDCTTGGTKASYDATLSVVSRSFGWLSDSIKLSSKLLSFSRDEAVSGKR
ncbi:cysteine hydrolase family protein [Paenibacillus humicola]|uniref:cysteine hydrolase family protein n=1 Tax=Paenibacillus humicola TaxID=3110540 RepID=UPI00237B63C9|nr:isochorismatase family cysteine hydrolase [Paenibacillus humicola]